MTGSAVRRDFEPPRALGPTEAADLADARLGQSLTAIREAVAGDFLLETTCTPARDGSVSCVPEVGGGATAKIGPYDCPFQQWRSADGARRARLVSCVFPNSSPQWLFLSGPISAATDAFPKERQWVGAPEATTFLRSVGDEFARVYWKAEGETSLRQISEPAAAIHDFDPSLYPDFQPGMKLLSRESRVDGRGLVIAQWAFHEVPN